MCVRIYVVHLHSLTGGILLLCHLISNCRAADWFGLEYSVLQYLGVRNPRSALSDRHASSTTTSSDTTWHTTPPPAELIAQILRFRSKDGMVRVEVNPTDDIAVIASKVTTPHYALPTLVVRTMEERRSTDVRHCKGTFSTGSPAISPLHHDRNSRARSRCPVSPL